MNEINKSVFDFIEEGKAKGHDSFGIVNSQDGELSLEAQATNYQTYEHINNVMSMLESIKIELSKRQFTHDRSKLSSPELDYFIKYTPKLKGSTYGSEEYMTFLKEMKPGLEHHYANNRHHPEFFPNGIKDMNLIDLVEMLVDFKAATLRHENGDLKKSLEINQKRFGYSDELKQIFINTIPYLRFAVNEKTQKNL